MKSEEIRQKFLNFFSNRGHKIIPSSSLLPTDPSVLFTTAGMQQFKRYYIDESGQEAEKDFGTKNVASIQRCLRTADIDEVGDERHLTFFEMLGNFSFGGYFKEEAIKYAWEFIKELGLKIDYVTIFDPALVPEDDWRKKVPLDKESEEIWKKYGVKIKHEGVDVFWGPTGEEGPCGPTTEIYINGIEIWNIVFNQFYCDANKNLSLLKIAGIDTGMGLERLVMVVNNKSTVFETDLFEPLIKDIPSIFSERQKRIIADHARAIVFLIADGVRPSNKDQGYVLRRLMRRMIAQQAFGPSGLNAGFGGGINMSKKLEEVVDLYHKFYPHLKKEDIIPVFNEEAKKYGKTIERGIKEISKIKEIDAEKAFYLFESFGLPYEAIKDIGGEKAKNLTREDFDARFKKHQEISRAGAEKKFGGHGLVYGNESSVADGNKEKIVKLHTATHLLQAALRQVLGDKIYQKGSNINSERLRFDFSFDRKLTPEEIKKVEDLVNEKIRENLPVNVVELSLKEALASGALHLFNEKYPERVKIYFIGNNLQSAFSKEFCAGPHVKNTSEIGKFKILKEEGVAAGIRRIRASISNE